MIHVHRMDGCAPSPLAHYLKALGIVRLVSEQADIDARGWWNGDHFMLATRLSRTELEGFFLRTYRPTALISPWNKGSGFYTNKPTLNSIEGSGALRFAPIRKAIEASRPHLKKLLQADSSIRSIKAEPKTPGVSRASRKSIRDSPEYKRRLRSAEKEFSQLKDGLIPSLRSKWRGGHREWLDAAMILTDDGPEYPALLGTGGNDGRLDFTLNFMEMLNRIFNLKDGLPKDSSHAWFTASIWGSPLPQSMIYESVGRYLPGTSGGANNSNTTKSDGVVNPVDFILMLEGTIAFIPHATRRLDSSPFRIASPFVVSLHGAGYASASAEDEKQKKEQWMPLWSRPSTYLELRSLLAEGRAQIGDRMAREPLDLARSIKSLGTARGIRAFQRYGYLERNGRSTLAVPLGTIVTANERSELLSCLDDIDVWLRRLRREARAKNAPKRLVLAERNLANGAFAAINNPDKPEVWQRMLFWMGETERVMARGSGFAAQPIPPLRPEWVTASNDNTAEFRLALAFALQSYARHSKRDGIRRHWIPLRNPNATRLPRFAVSGTGPTVRLSVQQAVVMRGHRGADDAIALVERRLVEGAQWGLRRLPLDADTHAWASVADLAALLSGAVDIDRTLSLARPLMALNHKIMSEGHAPAEPSADIWPDDAWIAIRLCTLPWKIKTRSGFELDVGTDPALVRRLATGDAATAVSMALRRLGAAGVRCTIRAATARPSLSRLWAASLAFPISKRTAKLLLSRIDPGNV